MTIGANQPYFLPYVSYWQMINASDVFYIGDNYNYIVRGWVNRNRILLHNKPSYFRIEVSGASSFKLMTELHIAEINKQKKLNQIYQAYHNAPYYDIGRQLVKEILDCREEILSEYLIYSIQTICRYLEIDTPIRRMSELEGNDQFKCEERIYDMCHRLGADTYINPIGGRKLYDVDEFEKQGIKLRFINTGDIKYKQFGDTFVEKLSILDVIMFNSKEEIREMLKNFELIS